MLPRLISISAAVLALMSGSTAALRAQEQLAMRGPRFVTVSPVTRRLVDASQAMVLKRRLSVDFEGVRLAAALDEISRQAGVQLIYSREAVPVEASVTLQAGNITLGAALTAVLFDTGLDVVLSTSGQMALVKKRPALSEAVAPTGTITGRVTDAKSGTALAGATVVVEGSSKSAASGNDGRYRVAEVAPGTYTVRARYIGYSPGTTPVTVNADQEATADLALEKSVQRLDEVVTTGTVVPTEVKALPTPISIVTADDIQRQNLQRVDQIFRGDVPGGIAWDLGPSGDYLSTISVRGASTLTASPTIKTFVNGVEVADQSFIATIDPSSVERIEITRGPQASTLYGAGALSGVMQVFTKKGELGLTRPELNAKLSAGGVGGFGGQSSALQTENSLSILGGSGKTSYNAGGSYRHIGDWVPTYNSTDWGISAGGQTSQGPLTLSGSARYAAKAFEYPWDTRFRSYTSFSQPPNRPENLRQQTYGLTATVQATRSWQHTLTLGYDQAYLSYGQTQPRFTTPADSFLFVYAGHEAQTSLLYHTDLSIRLAPAMSAVVTAGVNHTAYDILSSYTYGATLTTGSLNGTSLVTRTPSTNTGYFNQVQLSFGERLFLTGGVRLERNADFGADFGTAWSPRVGAAYVQAVGRATVKVRASYGESIRVPIPFEREAANYAQYGYQVLANPRLAPERQRGFDGGVEVNLGRASLGVTYYRQRAIDLIDYVNVPTPSGGLLSYQYQNLSRVKNEGWEFEAHLPVGPVDVAGTYSITNSTVQALPPNYPAGGYELGDRILAVPHTTAGAIVTYAPLRGTALSVSMTYIGDWIEHDYVALYGYYYGGQPYLGSDRAYWTTYPAVTKFAVGLSQELLKGLSAFLRAENVGNNLRSELANNRIPTPRSVLIGATVRY